MDLLATTQEAQIEAIRAFRAAYPALFEKDDRKLFLHLFFLLGLFSLGTFFLIQTPWLPLKIILACGNAFLWFGLINVTIHHHLTHDNVAKSAFAEQVLNVLYFLSMPSAWKRLNRYKRSHLNHHGRPFHASDLDHHYGLARYTKMKKNPWTHFLYFLELTFVGAHVPGWVDDRYMNMVSVEEWGPEAYVKLKKADSARNRWESAFHWTLFAVLVKTMPVLAWAWLLPMLLVKNWAHYLGQFQHYDEKLLEPNRSLFMRTLTFHIPSWINYLSGGELSGHFIHHIFPQMPYYHLEAARRRFLQDPRLTELFVIY